MKPILQSIFKHKKYLVLALLLALTYQILTLIDPQILRLIIDNYITPFDQLEREEFLRGVTQLVLLALVVAILARTAKSFQDYYVNLITYKSGADLYENAVKHTLNLPFAVFEDRQSGEILEKLQKARTDMQGLIEGFVGIVLFSIIGMLFVVIYAFTVHWIIGTLYIAIIPLIILTALLISRAIKKAQTQIVKQAGALSGSTTETIRNVELVKSLGLEEQEIDRLNKANNTLLGYQIQKIKAIKKLNYIQGILVILMSSGMLYVLFLLIFYDQVTVGEFFTLLIYSFFVFAPLGQIGSFATKYQEAKASGEALEEILSMKPEHIPRNAKKIRHIEDITFKDVTFRYAETNALQNIRLNIKKGQTIALVGTTGSGKSTIIKLLVGLYKPTEGTITINGVPHTEIQYDHLRKKIGFVAQEMQLFAGTIQENLAFTHNTVTEKDCLQALELAGVSHIITRNPLGLEAKIGEGGIKLSRGEKQRLAIARALIRKPDVLILDEATSALDTKTEQRIGETIQYIRKERPELIIIHVAHRLSTITHADRIFVLEKGSIQEKGSHDYLVHKKGLYYAFWRQQQAE